ncbi:hypothetical protein TNCV_3641091 [Trichonephila clavipes]|nr:hypothetical protein TNCV_3641091 [Trichonephila clavipes]
MPSEVPVDRLEGVDGLQLASQAYPTHALLDSSPVSMLANPYGRYPPTEGILLQCLHGEFKLWICRPVLEPIIIPPQTSHPAPP